MFSKMIRSVKIQANFSQRNIELFRKTRAIRWLSTESQPPKQAPPPPAAAASSVKPPSVQPKIESGKSKGPVTWKSLGYAAIFGAGVLVINKFNYIY